MDSIGFIGSTPSFHNLSSFHTTRSCVILPLNSNSKLCLPLMSFDKDHYFSQSNHVSRFKYALATLSTAAVLGMPLLSLSSGSSSILKPAAAVEQKQKLIAVTFASTDTDLDEEHRLLEEVWNLVSLGALDTTYNGHDWEAVKNEFRDKELPNRAATYAASRDMLKLLGDRYTRFLTPEAFAKMSKFDLSGSGMLLMPDSSQRLVVAAPPAKDSAAGQAGIVRGDVVLEIDGKPTFGLSPYEVAKSLAGDEGTKLQLTVATSTGSTLQEPRQVSITRHFSVKNPVPEAYLKTSRDGSRNIGYIRLTEFNASCTNAVRKAILDLEAQGADSYVLDIRENPGGVLDGAVEISGLFMPKGTTAVLVVDRSGTEEQMKVTPSELAKLVDKDTLALVTNRKSASSSEVLAGALRDNCRAVTVGTRTYGKGIIQGVFGLSDGSGVVLTVAKYQTPKHHEIHGIGIEPDFPMRLPPSWLEFNPASVDMSKAAEKTKMCRTDDQTAEVDALDTLFPSDPNLQNMLATSSLLLFQ